MTAFGHLPRTRILAGAPGGWSGDNNLLGIRVYRVPNMAGVWAQEYWEWRLHFGFFLLACTLVLAPLAVWLDHRNRAGREIFSHAITLQAARMLNLPCTEDEMVGSLTTYSYCRGLTRDQLLFRLRRSSDDARAWCERHAAKLHVIANWQAKLDAEDAA